jgi:hypothetical protein
MTAANTRATAKTVRRASLFIVSSERFGFKVTTSANPSSKFLSCRKTLYSPGERPGYLPHKVQVLRRSHDGLDQVTTEMSAFPLPEKENGPHFDDVETA